MEMGNDREAYVKVWGKVTVCSLYGHQEEKWGKNWFVIISDERLKDTGSINVSFRKVLKFTPFINWQMTMKGNTIDLVWIVKTINHTNLNQVKNKTTVIWSRTLLRHDNCLGPKITCWVLRHQLSSTHSCFIAYVLFLSFLW